MSSLSLAFLLCLVAPFSAFGAEYLNPTQGFRFDYDASAWEIVPEQPDAGGRAEAVDKAMAQKTLVTVQRKAADDRYHARFSVVEDSTKNFKGSPAEVLLAYRKHAIDFMNSQRFDILSTSDRELPGIKRPGFEVTANQRDFGLTFRQVGFVKDGKAYLLTAAARTQKFEGLDKEIKPLFDSFKFTQ